MNIEPASPKTMLLVIGYGNTLRSDDGVGPFIAETVAGWGLPGVKTLKCQQLSPEHACEISQAKTVVFVDASVAGPHKVQLRPLKPTESSQLMAHAADPRTMLALARDVYGRVPHAWWLTVPASRLDFAQTFSNETIRGCCEAITRLWELCESSRAN